MTIVLSSSWCMEGYDKAEDCYAIGDYTSLKEDPNIQTDSIEWSQTGWNDEKNYFASYLNNEIERYEKRYRTEVTHIALAGRVGVWNGPFYGGRIIDAETNPLECMGDVDDTEVDIDPDSKLVTLLGHHHDGTHRMNLYFLTEHKGKKYFSNFGEDPKDAAPEEFERLIKEAKPLKHSKEGEGYFNSQQKQAVTS
ncbi:hypothetical protein IMZ31_22250 (plasmid) [Pontibacillus sp. ALD_SL1]|uniref:hypothetical protein n=1 Tax=Pontibacillus sp. ALD_SL1 TaxID=2777185 RepID=UPI001A96EED1|nr:hypothetical protein [Pontibacillus sp. ALD_SL1]QST02177.1 hypothetical protein IMZ31_22250 [Pontibacillus sp. ALD_SL1]